MSRSLKSLLRALLPRSVKSHAILAGPLRGQRLVTSWHDYPAALTGRTERPLLDWFAENVNPGETWLDIGAHYGYTAIALSRLVGETGRVFAFEPMLATAGCVTQTRRLNDFPQLTVLPLGLAAPESLEIVHLPVTRGMADSTLAPQAGPASLEAILVARLDWLWPRINGGRPEVHGVKVDVQGMELAVLEGMAETLRAFRPRLTVEVHQGVDRAQLLSLLRRLGYAPGEPRIEAALADAHASFLDNHDYYFAPV